MIPTNRRRHPWFLDFLVFLAGIVAVVIIRYVDFILGEKTTFIAVYLVPIVFVTWYANGVYGAVLSLFSGFAWFSSYFLKDFPFQNLAVSLVDIGLKMAVLSGSIVLITRLKRALRRERELSRSDNLTGSFNRRVFFETLETEIARAGRYANPIAVLYLDVDDFKDINDGRGHAAGDRVLIEIVRTIESNVRVTDFCGRLGGDEFGVVFIQADNAAARNAAEKIFASLRENPILGGRGVTVSMGVAAFPRTGYTASAMIQLADDLMYSVKKGGKNAIRYKEFVSGSKTDLVSEEKPAK
jgi:diguanylate cyclase (GGDEF)-like protein